MFSFNGRTDGVGYLMACLAIPAVLIFWAIVHGIVAAFTGGATESSVATSVSGGGFLITLPMAIWILLAGLARRLHDIGASAWWSPLVLLLSPIASIVLFLTPSQSGENRYGV